MSINPTSQGTDILAQLFTAHFGQSPDSIELLPVSGSDRRYYRIASGNHRAIGASNHNVPENNSYFYFTELFRRHDINVPEVFAISKDHRHYLQQDLGNTTLFHKLSQEGQTTEVRQEFYKALDQLIKAQWIAGRQADFNQSFATKQFDEHAIMSDLLYFKYYFSDLQKIHYNRRLLMDEMESLSKELGRTQPQTLMYRDFQSRNLMLHDQKIWLIDFQGCMQGPPQYDLASLLWQAKAKLTTAWKEDLINEYIARQRDLSHSRMDELHFRKGYLQFVLLRLLQVLGAYGFRGHIERKPHFLSSVQPALQSLQQFLSDNPGIPSYPELRGLLERLVSKQSQDNYPNQQSTVTAKLLVTIYSFSYKYGIPKDKTGHGGGYVFDCRGILNPGRYKIYKCLTGKDRTVQEFINQETRMPDFLEHVYALVALNIDDYLSRGFEQLSISFGCTGGQHRSVYAAEQLAAWVKSHYAVDVQVTHLNASRWVLMEDDAASQQPK